MTLRYVVLALSSLLMITPALTQIVAAPDAPPDQRPVILQTSNGLPQIDITAPTAAGVSRNSFRQFDVDADGAIINNGRKASLTETGGWVAANPHMAGGSARVILNEVQSSDPSQLQGYLEIAGDKAELVIANPAGITCQGCGFIHASRVQLVTGTPEFQGTRLTGFAPGAGGLRIDGQGLDGRRVDAVALLSQAIEINAGLWANDLGIKLARSIDGTKTSPAFALDVAALGGMYAGKIWLVGTSDGLGVRNAGTIAATGTLTLSVDGKLENTGRLDASRVVLRADAIDNLATGSITGQDVGIGARRLSNAGHPDAAPLIAAENHLDIGAREIINTDQALIFSAGDMRIGGALDDNNQVITSSTSLINTDATIESLGDLNIHADHLYNLNKGVRTEERQIGQTTIFSYLQPQGSSEKTLLSNFRWESWSRAGRYRWKTNPDQISDGVLGKTPLPGVGEESCVDLNGQESCTPVAGALYTRDDPAWNYFGLVPPDEPPPQPGEAPTPPSLVLPLTPVNSADLQSAEYQSWLAQKTAYDQAWSDYNNAKTSHEQRVSAFNDWAATTDARREALDQAIANYNQSFSGDYITSWTQYINLQRAEFETVVTETHPGKIIAGGDITLVGDELVNDRSKILAGGQLRGSLGNLTNIDTPGSHRFQESGTSQHTRSRWRGGFKRYHQRDWGPLLPYLPADVITTTSLGTVETQDQSSSVDANSLQTLAEDTLQINQSLASLNPDNGPLLVTDPRFTQYRRWLSSEAMLTQLSHDPATMQKRIGDGFIEQKLLREQIAELTGRRFLPGYTADEMQYAALMESGLHHAGRLELRPGIELTSEQLAQLTSDLVWLVEQEVTIPGKNGQPSRTERVLVPRVYLMPRDGDLLATGGLISADRVNLVVSESLNNSATIVGHGSVRLNTGTLDNNGGDIRGERVIISAHEDINSQGGSVSAQNDLVLVAGRDVTLQSTTQSSERSQHDRNTSSTASRTNLDRRASLHVSGDGNLVVYAGRDLRLDGAQISHGGDGKTQLIAERDLQLQTIDTQSSTASHSHRNSANFLRESEQSEVGTRIDTEGDIDMVAGRDIRARAASISSNKGLIDIAAGRDVQLEAGDSGKEFAQGSQYKHRSVTGSKTTTQRFEEERSDALETLVSGRDVRISAGDDLQIKGSIVVADRDTQLVAGNDVSIVSATDTARISTYEHQRKSGVFSGPGVSVTVGKQQTEHTSEVNSTTQQASIIGAVQGDVSIVAGGDYRQEASQLLALSGSVQVEATNIDVAAGINTQDAANSSTFKQSGVTVSVSNPIVSAGQTLDHLNQARKNTTDGRAQALALASSAMTAANTVNDIQKDPSQATSITISVMAGSSKSESRSEQHLQVAAPSVIAGAGDVNLLARGDEAAGIGITGSQISAGKDVRLHSDGGIDLSAKANTATQTSTSKSSSNGVGVAATVGNGNVGIGVAISASRGRGNADGHDLSWTHTRIEAGQQADIRAEDDVNLRGATVTADQVTLRTSGDLHIESLQEVSRYASEQKQASADVLVPVAGKPSGQLSAGNQQVDSIYQSVNETSGIRAGDGGFDIAANGDATIIGGVITSTDDAHASGKNKFSSDTLTTSDISNHASYSASATNITLGASQKTSGSFTPSNTSAGYATDGDRADSVTRAGITGIAGDTNVRTGDADAPLQRIFDAGKVEHEVSANADIYQQFGLQASKAIGDYANSQLARADELREQARRTENEATRQQLLSEANTLESQWGDSGTARVFAHTLVGGLTGGVDGAAGAATGTLTAAYLGEALRDAGIDDTLADSLTALAATTAGALTGNAPGAVAALNEVANNYLSHAEARRYAELSDKKLFGRCDTACDSELKALKNTDKQRDAELRACENIQTPACDATRRQVRYTAAEYIRIDQSSLESLDYNLHRLQTTTLAEDTMDGTRPARATGFGQAVVDGVTDLAKGAWIGFKAIAGDPEARQQVVDGAHASFEFLSDLTNWRYLFGALTPEKKEELALAYEQGDGKAVGRILGEQWANTPIGGGGLGTLKNTGKGINAASNAGKLADKTPTHPDYVEHIIGGDFNARSRKVTGGHSLLNDDVRIVEVVSPPDANGVYRAFVEIRQPDGKWVRKENGSAPNTMFPADWGRERIVEEIDSAWKNQTPHENPLKWRGESKSGVVIEGYKVNNLTAFPIYKKGK